MTARRCLGSTPLRVALRGSIRFLIYPFNCGLLGRAPKRPMKHMSTQDDTTYTNVRMTEREVESLKAAARERFGSSSRITLGGVAHLLATESYQDSDNE